MTQSSTLAQSGPLRIIFMGTPEFACEPLKALAEADGIEVNLVVTRPDAASGRGKTLLPSPVKQVAQSYGLPILETASLKSDEIYLYLSEIPCDVMVVAAYGAIVPVRVIELPRYDIINLHASLLPKGRGAAPMQQSLLHGEPKLGYSIMRIEEGLDSGPYCLQGSVEVGERTYEEVSLEVSKAASKGMLEVLNIYAQGKTPEWIAQDDSQATFAPKLAKSDVLLDPSLDANHNMCRIQASSDAAPARCIICDKSLRVMKAHVISESEKNEMPFAMPKAGAVSIEQKKLLLGCESGSVLEVLELKPDGKRSMHSKEFIPGLKSQELIWKAC